MHAHTHACALHLHSTMCRRGLKLEARVAAGLPQRLGAAKVKAQKDAKEEEKKAAGLKRKADKEAQDEASKEARWGGVGGGE